MTRKQGNIAIEDTKINELVEEKFRDLIGVVFQDSFLLRLSIKKYWNKKTGGKPM